MIVIDYFKNKNINMSKIVENYLLLDNIGKGEFGDVYKAKHT